MECIDYMHLPLEPPPGKKSVGISETGVTPSVGVAASSSNVRVGNGSQPKGGGDEIMQSSPFMSSQMQQQDELADIPEVTTITLVREEELASMEL